MKLNVLQIARKVLDEISGAIRVKLTDTEINLALDSKEDSIESHPAKLVVKVEGIEKTDKEAIPAMDCSSLREIQVYVEGEGEARVLVSPEDKGDFFVEQHGRVIVARRLKVEVEGVEGTVHLVGRS